MWADTRHVDDVTSSVTVNERAWRETLHPDVPLSLDLSTTPELCLPLSLICPGYAGRDYNAFVQVEKDHENLIYSMKNKSVF